MPATNIKEIISFQQGKKISRPLYVMRVKAGFPSPAEDFIDKSIDLNEHLIAHPTATFFVRVAGDSMTGAGIFDGDLLIVDRALEAANGDIIVAILDGEFTVKRLRREKGKLFLNAENPKYKPIAIREGQDFEVWGVVSSTIHKLK